MRKSLQSMVGVALALGLAVLPGSALAQTQTKVLFDGAHGQMFGNADWVLDEDSCGTPQRYPTPSQTGITASTSESYWSGGFSAFGVDLVKKGFWVESLPPGVAITYGNSSNPQDLSNYKVFVIPEPNLRFSTAEKSAIIAFVRNGGGLFMIADHWNSDRNNDGWDSPEIFNDLMVGVSWGIHFQVEAEANNWFNDNPNYNFTSDTSSPILYGPHGSVSVGKGLGLFGSTSMTLSPGTNSTVKGHVWMTSGTKGSNTQVTFATTTDGSGRVAAIGDSSPAEDATNNCGHTTYDGWTNATYDNAKIHLNAMAWLAGGGGGGGGGDTTPPTAPSNLGASAVSSNQVNLSWTASTDNVGVAGYNIYRSTNGTSFSAVASTTTTSHSDTGLAASTTYYYRVTADDAAGNESPVSNTASATTPASGGGGSAKVIINEILANEPGSTTAAEFVELVNVGGSAIDISGWTVSDAAGTKHIFASGTSVAAGMAIVVYGGASAIPGGLTNAVAASTGSLALGNSGDTVTVKNASGATIDTFTYTSALAGTDGVSMNRSPDASATGSFVLHTSISSLSSSGGTRADGSPFSSGGGPAKVIINEILANEPGSTTAAEFVELLNVGGSAIDISGWTVSDAAGTKHTFASGTSVAAGKAIVVYGGASSIPGGLNNAVAASTGSLALGNSGDTVTVKDASATTIDTFTYTSALSGTDGVSMNRSPDASDTGSFVLHTSISSLSSSGGTRADGSAF